MNFHIPQELFKLGGKKKCCPEPWHWKEGRKHLPWELKTTSQSSHGWLQLEILLGCSEKPQAQNLFSEPRTGRGPRQLTEVNAISFGETNFIILDLKHFPRYTCEKNKQSTHSLSHISTTNKEIKHHEWNKLMWKWSKQGHLAGSACEVCDSQGQN